MDIQKLCAEVRKIARTTGEFQKSERAKFNHSKVEEKSAYNYVSYVDMESERLLVDALSLLLPEAGFISEEETVSRTGERYNWIVDPLDGTTNYIRNNAPYCISIALSEGDDILLGVVYEICRDECFYSWKGAGASWLNGEEIRVSDVDVLSKAFVALGFPYSFGAYKPVALRLVDRLYGHSCGCRLQGAAAVELCYVACGRFDARVEAHLGPWDVAAGGFILEQAGGKLTDFSGGNSWKSGKEVVASNTKLCETMLHLIAENI
ncbi:MAG: inositol monophosphatase [Tannerellaceae bacterium]|jgi:myo-inositol-1(or 4)-monophosphatase|nr:inositol monophosphatase [Tannerellaceae bacterium]